MSPLVVADASVVPAPPVWATSDGGLTAQPPAVVPVVIIVGPPTASEKEAITYEPVIKVVVLMIEVAAMIELAVVEMAFARSKVALSGTSKLSAQQAMELPIAVDGIRIIGVRSKRGGGNPVKREEGFRLATDPAMSPRH